MTMAKSINIEFVLIADWIQKLSDFIDLNGHMIIDLNN